MMDQRWTTDHPAENTMDREQASVWYRYDTQRVGYFEKILAGEDLEPGRHGYHTRKPNGA